MIRTRYAVLFAAVLLAGACGSPNASSDAEPAEPPQDGGSYKTMQDIGKILDCDPERIVGAVGAVERGSCEGGNLVISIYLTRDEAMDTVRELQRTAVDGAVGGFVVGNNWSVNCGDATTSCTEVKDKLGGILY